MRRTTISRAVFPRGSLTTAPSRTPATARSLSNRFLSRAKSEAFFDGDGSGFACPSSPAREQSYLYQAKRTTLANHRLSDVSVFLPRTFFYVPGVERLKIEAELTESPIGAHRIYPRAFQARDVRV
jgi:hypothetical protein